MTGYRTRTAAPRLPFSPLAVDEVMERYARARAVERAARRRLLLPPVREHLSLFWPGMAAYQGDLRRSVRVRTGEPA